MSREARGTVGWCLVSMELSTTRSGRYTIVTVSGDLDVTSCRPFEQCLNELRDSPLHLVVDLTGLTFMDTTGLSLLVRRWQDLDAAGGSLTLLGASYQRTRVLWTTGLIGRIPHVDSLAELESVGEDLGAQPGDALGDQA